MRDLLVYELGSQAAIRLSRVPLALALVALMGTGVLGQNFRNFKGKECTVKTSASPRIGKIVAKRIDNYVEQFADFYKPLKLKKKNDNKIIARIFGTYDDYAEHYERRSQGKSPPTAYFSSSMNAIVLYNDELDVTLRQTLFHECSHNFMNRFIYDAPAWLNEGMAEYFEGWRITPEGEFVEVRPNLYDLIIVRNAIEEDALLPLEELMGLSRAKWNDYRKHYPELHGYLHYCMAWSLVYYCLEGQHAADREAFIRYLRDLNEEGDRARLQIDDWDAFEDRWRATLLEMDLERLTAEDHVLVAGGHRSNRDWKAASAEYALALEKDPEYPRAQYWLGYCLKRRGKYDEATEALEAALEKDPSEAGAAYLLSRIALGVDMSSAEPKPKLALAYSNQALDIVGGKSVSYLLMRARCEEAAGRAKDAVKTVQKILSLVEPDEKDVYKKWLTRFKDAAKEQRRR